MRSLRRGVDVGLAVIGAAIVLGAVLALTDLRLQIVVVLVGLLLVEAGVWKLAYPLLPDSRKNRALRAEVERFLELVRRLNAAGTAERAGGPPGEGPRFEEVKREMEETLERIARAAGPPG